PRSLAHSLYHFLFHSPPHRHRYLHSFPTRRSSDLLEYLRTVIRYIHQNPVKAGLVQMPEEWKWSSCSGYYGQGSMPKGLLDCELDRKSTRLNSSHVKISYAVFCLKKKNNEAQERPG